MTSVNAFDLYIISFFNQLGHFSGILNNFLLHWQDCNLATLVPFTMLLWGQWFRTDVQDINNRKCVVSILISCAFVAAIFFILQESPFRIGFRLRPMFNPQSTFHMPDGIDLTSLSGWKTNSSFPSGHSMLLAAISVGFLYISRPLGAMSLIYSLIICLIRVFFGFHYLTDIVVGALGGVAAFYLANTRLIEKLLTDRLLKWAIVHPSSFYAALFFISLDIATGFAETRAIIQLVLRHT